MSLYTPKLIDNLSEYVPGTTISKYCLWNIYKKCLSINNVTLPYNTIIGNVSVMIFKHEQCRRAIVKFSNNTFIFDL
jgi:hypothetical protein